MYRRRKEGEYRMSSLQFANEDRLKTIGRYLIFYGYKRMMDCFEWKGKSYKIEVKIVEVKK